MHTVINSADTAQTEAAGAALARMLSGERAGRLWFICLTGELGAGKTAFVRGFAAEVSPGSRVKSPSYTLVNEYRGGAVPLFHFDLYRLGEGAELDSIGFGEYTDAGHCILEWSEYLDEVPDGAVHVDIRKSGEGSRVITIDY